MPSKIEWTDETWNPVTGCTHHSAGCDHCYAVSMTKRLAGSTNPKISAKYHGLIGRNGHFNGVVRCHEDTLDAPLRWKKPRMVFVNSMSDLFHRDVPTDFIQRVFDVMRRCPQHIFQILTKRADRLVELESQIDWPDNVWMGVSVENQATADRCDKLRDTGAKIRFLSLEPLLGPVDIPMHGVDWVIVGGESGPGARPMDAEWVRAIRDRCVAQGVALFFKQWGGVNKKAAGRELDGRAWDEMPIRDAGSKRKIKRTKSEFYADETATA